MAKKKTQSKKHKFKHAAAAPVPGRVEAEQHRHTTETATPVLQRSRVTAAAGSVVTRDFSYVVGDLRRIMAMASGLVVLEFILWGLLDYTSLGDVIYGFFQV